MQGRIELAMDGASFTFKSWNREAERVFGYRKADVIGRPAADIVRSVDERLRARREAEVRRQGWWWGPSLLLDRDGEPIVIETVCRKHSTPDGVEYVSVAREVSPHIARDVPDAGTWRDALRRASLRDMNVVPNTDRRKPVAENIRRARLDAGLSQRQLAEHLGIQRTRIIDYEQGRMEPLRPRIAEIARITGAPSVGWFYDPHDQ